MGVSELRVGHVSTMTRWGGVERMLADLLIHRANGATVHSLLTTSSAAEVLAPVLAAGVRWYEPARGGRYDPRAIGQMAAWLRREGIQVVHTYNGYANAWGAMAARLARVPVLITGEHGTVWRMAGPMAWLDRWAQRSAAAVITNSAASRDTLRWRYGVAAARIRVVANAIAPLPPVDVAQVRAELGVGDALLVGSVGRLDTDKAYHVFIEAARRVLADWPATRFVLVGGGPLEASLRQQAAGLGDRFIMTGWRADARALVQAFDLFVSTSIHETFGNGIIEAALAGVPAIAPAVDGMVEAVVDGETGRLLLPTVPVSPVAQPGASSVCRQVWIDGCLGAPLALDPAELATAIQALLDDGPRRAAYGRQARQRAESHFSIERYAADLERIYGEALAARLAQALQS